jgi:hypothetical protein
LGDAGQRVREKDSGEEIGRSYFFFVVFGAVPVVTSVLRRAFKRLL